MLKDFESTQNEIEWLNLKCSNNWRGKTALTRMHENEIGCSFPEFDRENLY